jgi:hypothetical protein
MPDATVTRLRPRTRSGYSDTAALNDIHALLTSSQDGDLALLGDVAQIQSRTGRIMVRVRDIEVSTSETALGWPVARIESGDTTLTVRQDPAGPGLLIEIVTSTPGERDALAVTLDGRRLHPASPPGGHCA